MFIKDPIAYHAAQVDQNLIEINSQLEDLKKQNKELLYRVQSLETFRIILMEHFRDLGKIKF